MVDAKKIVRLYRVGHSMGSIAKKLDCDKAPGTQMIKNLPAMQDTQVRSLGREDPLEKQMTTHSSILAWKIPWTEEPGGPQSMGLQKAGHD